MITFETACKEMYESYKRLGFPGIDAVGDVGEEWVFLQATDGEADAINFKPIFYNKRNGKRRHMNFWDKNDQKLLNKAIKLNLPPKYCGYDD